jgi:hypothetical protein
VLKSINTSKADEKIKKDLSPKFKFATIGSFSMIGKKIDKRTGIEKTHQPPSCKGTRTATAKTIQEGLSQPPGIVREGWTWIPELVRLDSKSHTYINKNVIIKTKR